MKKTTRIVAGSFATVAITGTLAFASGGVASADIHSDVCATHPYLGTCGGNGLASGSVVSASPGCDTLKTRHASWCDSSNVPEGDASSDSVATVPQLSNEHTVTFAYVDTDGDGNKDWAFVDENGNTPYGPGAND